MRQLPQTSRHILKLVDTSNPIECAEFELKCIVLKYTTSMY